MGTGPPVTIPQEEAGMEMAPILDSGVLGVIDGHGLGDGSDIGVWQLVAVESPSGDAKGSGGGLECGMEESADSGRLCVGVDGSRCYRTEKSGSRCLKNNT